MGTIFISHSSLNNAQAIEIRDWLRAEGWRDTFLDLDPAQGLAPGQRWQEELKKAGERCAAVIVLVSPDWIASKWCQVEFLLASQLGKRIFGVIIAPTPLANLPIELTAHYQLVDASDKATAQDGLDRLRWGLKRAGLDPRDFPWPPPDEAGRRPYRGLLSLEEKDAGIFFGREAPTTRGLDALRRIRDGAPERLLVILGASGAGKSSFLKAGLLARLRRDEENFLVLPTVRPARAALTGPDGLFKALGVAAAPSREELGSRLNDQRTPVVDRLARFASAARQTHRSRPPTLVLPIDQAEELFSSDSPESPAFFDLLRQALEVDDNLAVVVTIRSDCYGSLQGERRLADVAKLPFDLPPLSPAAFKEIIEGPGRLAQPSIVFEPALTDRLVTDLDQADALPLLAFTLERLVTEYGADQKLELSEYEQRLGGLSGAIERAIEAAFSSATADPSLPRERTALEALARSAFIPWLVRVDEAAGAPKRRVAALKELPEQTRNLIQHFVNQRLLVSRTGADGEVVEVSHESILRHWKGLSRWIDEERATLLALEAARSAAAQWQRHRTVPGTYPADEWLVHRGDRLLQAEALLGRADYAALLTDADRAYLTASRRREDEERRKAEEQLRNEQRQVARQRRLQRLAGIALAAVALVLLAFGSFAVVQLRTASRENSLMLTEYARQAVEAGYPERAARLAALAAREGPLTVADSGAATMLAAAAGHSSLILGLPGGEGTNWSIAPQGQRLLSWSADGAARVWDAASGKEIARHSHAGGIAGAVFSANGGRVVSWGKDGTVRVWDPISGREIARQTHERPTVGAAFAGNGDRILSWDKGTALLWDSTSARVLVRDDDALYGVTVSADGRRIVVRGKAATIVGDATSGSKVAESDPESVNGEVFSPDATQVLSWSGYRAWVWDVASGRDVASQVFATRITGAVFAPDGRRALLLSHDDGSVWNWDVISGKTGANRRHAGGVDGAVFTADGKRMLTWGDDWEARVWDAASGRSLVARAHVGGVRGAAFVDDGRNVVSWGGDGTATIWEASSGRELGHPASPGLIGGAVFVDDGERAVSWSTTEGTARIWNAASGQEIARLTHPQVVDVTLAPDGGRLLSSGGGTARVWDLAGHEIGRVTHEGLLFAKFSADGKRILSRGDETVHVWDLQSGRELASQTHEGTVQGAVFAADGQRVLSWSTGGTARVWSASSGKEIARQTHKPAAGGAVFAADDKRVLSWGSDGTARVWDAATGREIARQVQPDIEGAALVPDGQRVISWGPGGAAVVWDASSGREIARHGSAIGAEFDSAGRSVVSSGTDGTVSVWDPATGRQIAAQSHGRGALGAVFAADGRRVISWGIDGTARVWDATSGVEIARQTHDVPILHAVVSKNGKRVILWGLTGSARVWDISWSLPRNSNRALIAEVCERTLRGPEEADTRASIRRVTAADAMAAPILRNRVGEDACRPAGWFSQIAAWLSQ